MAGWIKMPLGTEVGLGPGNFVLDGVPASLPKKGEERPLQFSAHFCCGQTVGSIKVPLGIAEGLSPGDFVLDGDTAPPPQKGGAQFSDHVYCGQTTGCVCVSMTGGSS